MVQGTGAEALKYIKIWDSFDPVLSLGLGGAAQRFRVAQWFRWPLDLGCSVGRVGMALGCRLGPPTSAGYLGTSRVTLPFSPQAAPPCPRTEEAGALTRDEYEEDSSDEEVGLGLRLYI